MYRNLNLVDAARDALQNSLEIEPAQPNAYASLGNLSLQAGDGLDYVRQFIRAIEVDPVDHELPGILATFLYEIGLIEEGDDFRERVLAIAPTSPVAYQAEILRAINTGDEVSSVAAARRAIEDDIEDRRFSFGGAVQHLLRVAARRGTVDEESAYLDEHAPNILDIDEPNLPFKYKAAQPAAFDAWYVSLPREEMLARLDRVIAGARAFGFTPEADPPTHIGILALQGRTDEAIDVALASLFTESAAVHLGWRRSFAMPQYADIVADPRIREAMQRWEDEEARMRDEISAYLSDLSEST